MSLRSKSLLLITAVLLAAFAFLLTPQFHTRTAASDVTRTTTVKNSAAPSIDTQKIAPADVLGTGAVYWQPATGEN